MKQTVYVDVLLAVNFFMNYFLLLSAGKILRATLSRTRLCLAAVFGAAAALSIFLPRMGAFTGALYKLAVSAGMVLIAFSWHGLRSFGRNLLVICAVTFGFGGTMFALWLTVAPHGMVYRNGVIYFNIPPLFLVGVTLLCYAIITVAGKVTLRLERLTKLYDASVTARGHTVRLHLLCDTGNCLTEPFSGAPVIVVRRAAIADLLPPRFTADASADSAAALPHFRVIPYTTVHGGGLLTAFRPDAVVISDKGRSWQPSRCFLAVTEGFDGEEYDGIIPPALLE